MPKLNERLTTGSHSAEAIGDRQDQYLITERHSMKTQKNSLVMVQERIEQRIFMIRGKKVMLDRDLAQLYKVPTKRLNEQVKRNLRRFPDDFMFVLTQRETNEVVANCDHLKDLKFSHSLPTPSPNKVLPCSPAS
jgi:hypothetical protein